MSAKAIYGIQLTFGIVMYHGEWDGNEKKMEEQSICISDCESFHYAQALFQRLAKECKTTAHLPVTACATVNEEGQ